MTVLEYKRGSGLPKTAGDARLDWSDVRYPERTGENIVLPEALDTQFFPLLNGKQFLLMTGDGLYFGGTDERPFLVELYFQAWRHLVDGEEAFYQALKPEAAIACEKLFNTQAIRQGDWFAVPLPASLTWGKALGIISLNKQSNEMQEPKVSKDGKTVGRTRHKVCNGRLIHLTGAIIAEGTLCAPDHTDRELVGPHALFQTAFLKDPQKAD